MAYFIGLMSGTSMDAVDAALIDFSDNSATLIKHYSVKLPSSLKSQLGEFIRSTQHDIRRQGELDVALGHLFADAALGVLGSDISPSKVAAIGSHGQTVFHAPYHQPPFTLQIGDPNIIAEKTGITTVADFRRRDIAVGGQGAPLVPAFHNAIFRSSDKNRVVLNIGGIANITVLPADQNTSVIGFDTGPGNTLMDNWIEKHHGKPMDKDGQWAASGHVNETALRALLQDPYFSSAPPKSTGREHFNLDWLAQFNIEDSPENIQATLNQLTVESVAQAIAQHSTNCDELYVCGGGAYNQHLMKTLQQRLGKITVTNTGELGLAPEWVEAAAFAWLAKQTLEGKPGNLPSVTGASRPVVLGGIYPAPKI